MSLQGRLQNDETVSVPLKPENSLFWPTFQQRKVVSTISFSVR